LFVLVLPCAQINDISFVLLANYEVNSTVSLEARSPVVEPHSHSQTSGGDTVRATESHIIAVSASKPTYVVEKRKNVETVKPLKKRKSGKL
jgi:hypothetical protein